MVAAHIKEKEMIILVDGKPASLDTETIATLKDLIGAIERELIPASRVITRITLNEEELDESQEIGLGAFPLKDIVSLSVETADTSDLAVTALEDAIEYLPQVSAMLEDCAARIREGELMSGLSDVSETLEIVSAFTEILDSMRNLFQIDFGKIEIDDTSLLEKLRELDTLARAILDSAKKEDWVLMADQLEYELSPLLYEWMAVIPELIALIPEPETDEQ